MAKNEVKRCMEWLFQQQSEMEARGFGRGPQAIMDALHSQKSTATDIRHFRNNMDKTLATQRLSQDVYKDLDTNFNAVTALSDKRRDCLETVTQIAALEDLVQGLSVECDRKAVHLVNTAEANRGKREGHTTTQSNESLARASQSCVQAVRANWAWTSQVMQCAQVHLRNAAAFHEFFHEVEEAEHWMDVTLSRIHLTFDRSKLQGDRQDAKAIMAEIKEVLSGFLQWQTKGDYLYERAKRVVPVPARLTPLTEESRPCIALSDFSTKQLNLIEGETLHLVDNSDRHTWKVRTETGQVGEVPAVIILLPSPYGPATDAVIRLRLQLLSLWTGSVKRLGYQLIAFMLLVFRDWSEDEVTLLQQLSISDRRDLLRVLTFIEATLNPHWHGYGDFQELVERLHRLAMILEESEPSDKSGDNEFLKTTVVQITTLEDLLKKYQDFWAFWETFKAVVELLKQPEFLLVCDKWEQLRYVTTAHFVRWWDTRVDVAEGDLTKQTASLALCEAPSSDMSMSDIVEEEKEEVEAETVNQSLIEEETTFIYKAVLDPRDGMSVLDLQQAISLGVVDQTKGLYVNPLTGESWTMSEAMQLGKVIVEQVSKRKIREEKKNYGLITLKITKDVRSYTITGVMCPKEDKELSVIEATKRKILDAHDHSYTTETGEKLSIQDAIHSGLVKVEYHEDDGQAKHEEITKTYAVHGVVDQKKKGKMMRVSFTDAVRQGLLDRDTGEYVHNVTGQKIGVQEAIMRGFIKARIVQDPSKLEIDPRNMIVVQKLESAKTKLMRGVRAIKMFKQAEKDHHDKANGKANAKTGDKANTKANGKA